MKKHLIFTPGVRGCPGKTIALVAIADYLHSKGQKFITLDCDLELAGRPSSFSHWFGGATLSVDIFDEAFADEVLNTCHKADADFVLADFPPNVFEAFYQWQQALGGSLLGVVEEMATKAIAVVPIAARPGVAQSAQQWVELVRDWASCVLALNNPDSTNIDNDQEKQALSLACTIEGGVLPSFQIPNLRNDVMADLLALGKLPSQAIQGPDLKASVKLRVQGWARKIHANLEKTGLFLPSKVAESR